MEYTIEQLAKASQWASDTMKRVDRTMLLEDQIVNDSKQELFNRFCYLINSYLAIHYPNNFSPAEYLSAIYHIEEIKRG